MILPSLCAQSFVLANWKEKDGVELIYVQMGKNLYFMDGATLKQKDAAGGVWARLTVRSAVNTPSLGANPLNVDQGTVYFDLFAPEDYMDLRMKPTIKAAFNMFQNKNMTDSDGDTATTFSPTVNEIGFDGQFRHWQLSVEYYATWCSDAAVTGKSFDDGFDSGYA